MSGHSKWNNIKNKKGKADAARGKIFTKLGRELLIAVKEGGPDPAANSKLKDVVAKCKANNMPNDTISNAIKKASGAGDSVNYEEIVYEGYGINGVAIIMNVSTDNRNRTAAELRHVFTKAGGNLGTTGCVSYLFNRKGVIVIEKEYVKHNSPVRIKNATDEKKTSLSEDDLMLIAIDSGAEDFSVEEEVYEITTSPEAFSTVREALEKENIEFIEAEIQMVPNTYIKLDEHNSERMQNMIDSLEDLDDVMDVYHNWEF